MSANILHFKKEKKKERKNSQKNSPLIARDIRGYPKSFLVSLFIVPDLNLQCKV